jgi:hypothetical protein
VVFSRACPCSRSSFMGTKPTTVTCGYRYNFAGQTLRNDAGIPPDLSDR